jgi:hypothetical protein
LAASGRNTEVGGSNYTAIKVGTLCVVDDCEVEVNNNATRTCQMQQVGYKSEVKKFSYFKYYTVMQS